jgi:small-conductance mechanosensitive channel
MLLKLLVLITIILIFCYDVSLGQSTADSSLSTETFREFTLQRLIKAAVSLLVAYGLIAGFQSLINWVSEKTPRRFRLIIKQFVPFIKGIILVSVISYLLQLFVNLSQKNIFALTGTIAVALGFAFKDYISSIIAGVVALFEAPYRVGDRIKIGESYGEVVRYGLRGIRLQTPDDNLVTIPHNKIWTETISNANAGQLEAQVVTKFFFDHTIDVEWVIKILYQAAYSSKYTNLKFPIVVIVEEKIWGTLFKLKCYPMDARDEFVYQTDLIRRTKQVFADKNLPYPKLSNDFSD